MSEVQNAEEQIPSSLEEMRDDEVTVDSSIEEHPVRFIVPPLLEPETNYHTTEYKVSDLEPDTLAEWLDVANSPEDVVIIINGEREWLYGAHLTEEGTVLLMHS